MMLEASLDKALALYFLIKSPAGRKARGGGQSRATSMPENWAPIIVIENETKIQPNIVTILYSPSLRRECGTGRFIV